MGKKNDCSGPVIHATGFTINGCTFNVDPKYHPIGAIGQGSYGVVCSVRNTETNEKLAIKKITPMAGDEWDATHTLREIRLMRCLGAHENIISLKHLSMCKEKDELYMMMELADTDLHRLIQSSCALTPGHIRVIMYQILSGVKAMHDNGVLHRDLKPGNLLLNKDCELKITDFGLARMMPTTSSHPSHLEATASSDNVSMMTEYVVTRWYRPPELMLAPNGSYDGAIDMWSVGCILGELLARKPLFPGTDFMDQLTRIFQVIAIPKPDDRGYSIEKDALKFLSSLSPPVSGALEAKLGDLIDPQALDLLRRLLCFNPKTRLSSDDALAHPFFQGIEDEWGAISRLHLPHSLEFAFETQSLPLATLRQYICDEVLAFTTPKATEPHASESPIGKIPETTVSTASTTSKKDTIAKVLENDCPAGSGFTVKGCDFHVSERYKPLQVLGEGSYGIVCAASDSETRKNVAIKKITPMAGDEWDAKHTLREIRLMRYFGHHPNIASLQSLSTCMEKDELYLMMELMDTDLHRLIQSKTKLEPTHVAAIMYQLLCGAQTLHENGVLHRDLKPGNLLVSKNCDVKITDFGLSRYIPPTERHSTFKAPTEGRQESHSLMTEYVVTRWYRPPELMLAPTGTYNEAVDMWSIGCIFGELLNRRPLFPGSDFLDQLARVFRVLPLPSPAERGYDVEGDARAFLEKLPPCSPSALNALFPRASSEAVHLLQQLLCVNPKRRLSAKQALAHPYFNQIRSQLGDPPVFHVDKAFDFEFDYQDFPLTHLKTLIQSEVTLLQKQGLAPPSSAPKEQDQEAIDDDVYATEKLKATKDTPEDDLDASVLPASEPEADERKVVIKEQRKQQQDEEESNEKLSKQLETVEIEKPNNEEDILHSIVQDVKSSTGLKQPMASTAVSWKSSSAILQTTTPSTSLSRSKSTGTSLRRALTPSLDSTKINRTSNISRESRDEDDVTSVASTSSNNRSHQKSTHSSSLSRKWGHSRSTAMASTASSRYRSAAQTSSTSLIHKTASLLSSRTSERLSSSDNNNQQYTRRLDSSDCESVKSDVRQSSMAGRNGAKSHRQLQVVSDPSSTSSSPSTAFTPETFTSRKGSNHLTRRPGSTSSSSSSSSSSTSLPKEWARRTDPKTGRLFYVHLVTNRSYAKLPSSVTAVMLNLGRDAIVKKRTEKMDQDRRRPHKPKPKPTIPYSPQFAQMSWQRKKALNRHDCV